jgi:hypothetical protein
MKDQGHISNGGSFLKLPGSRGHIGIQTKQNGQHDQWQKSSQQRKLVSNPSNKLNGPKNRRSHDDINLINLQKEEEEERRKEEGRREEEEEEEED